VGAELGLSTLLRVLTYRRSREARRTRLLIVYFEYEGLGLDLFILYIVPYFFCLCYLYSRLLRNFRLISKV